MQQIMKEFEAANPGVDVKLETRSVDEHKSAMRAAGRRRLKAEGGGYPPITFGGSVNWHVMRLMDVLLETQCGAKTHDGLKAMKARWTETACATAAFNESTDALEPAKAAATLQAFIDKRKP